jgi:5-formyltetrahydrofolate cyclo-ligase
MEERPTCANDGHTSETIDVADVGAGSAPAKAALRARLLAARAARSTESLQAARASIARFAVAGAGMLGCVAGYVPLRTEPGSSELLAGLADAGARVLVPVLRPDRDLDWVTWPDRDPGELAEAAAVFVPALAVDAAGFRLGRGGGSYDRALGRCAPGTALVALVFDDELLATVPTDPWDRPVTDALTPSGWVALGDPE